MCPLSQPCILTVMLIRRRVWRVRSFSGPSVSLALALLVFGAVAAPFCRCVCGRHGTAAAAEVSSCHGHAGRHGPCVPTPPHPCEHAGCAALTATMPQLPEVAPLGSTSTPLVGGDPILMPLDLVTSRPALMRPWTDRDIGPPVPITLFTILRP